MVDFFKVKTEEVKGRKKDDVCLRVYPSFLVGKSKDLMIRGGDFYAIWLEDRQLWSLDEDDVISLIDHEVMVKYQELKDKTNKTVVPSYMRDAASGMIDAWHRYCQKQLRDNYHMLDEKLIFSNDPARKDDYASKRLPYPLEAGDISAWDRLVGTLYSPEERHKIEWVIGSIVTGDSKTLQKFMVLYGSAGTGKSTIINVIQSLFDGYYSVFDARALGSSSASFALEAFKNNPLVAIQHDGDLSRIEDNTRLNSLVSHELMTVNEKFKSTYSNRFKAFLIMGTNKPVKITDSKSGLLRRLIDVQPSGNKLDVSTYRNTLSQVSFELGAIAYHCKNVYLEDPDAYDDYTPYNMMGATNDFYDFMMSVYHIFKRDDCTTSKAAWEMYKVYCDDAKVPFPYNRRLFREELKNYFKSFENSSKDENGNPVFGYYVGFRTDKFGIESKEESKKPESKTSWIDLKEQSSIFDDVCASCQAQYGNQYETPNKGWDDVSTTLSDLDTSKLHYVRVPLNHIVIDFDIKDDTGAKSYEKNIEAASKWPATYAETSKGGSGLHLHYIYTGEDVEALSRLYDEDVEVKVFTGKSSLRRKLTKCNNLPIATISSGLPIKDTASPSKKGDGDMLNFNSVQIEKGIRTTIKKCLNKEVHPNTKPSVDFIKKVLDDAYNSGTHYDVSDMKNAVIAFANSSTHNSDYCLELTQKMHFKSEEPSLPTEAEGKGLVFFDIEIFPNLFLVNWKAEGEGKQVVRMINPSSVEIEELLKFKLVGFNCRRYDNHILYGRLLGHSVEELYQQSQDIINGEKGDNKGMFSEAYNLSYTDVYDFCSKKQSLKKWEIELGIHHQELGLPWDKPVPEERWEEVAAYCDNDVIATEAVFNARKADFVARQIQVDLVKLLHGADASVNDTTNTLSTKIIFGNNREPQGVFNYRDLAEPVGSDRYEEYKRKFGDDYAFRVFDADGLPQYRSYIPGETLPEGWSILPFFPGYKYEFGKSTYLGEDIGEGGRVYSKPGIHGNVWDGDIASQHPHSVIYECLFGPEYTKRFEDIVDARVAIKHLNFETAGSLLNGALKPYLNEEQAPDLAQALKIVINSIYGLTSAKFINPFRDARNVDNIVAKRGALFMTLLKREVIKKGYEVAHIKTDSIKIPDADDNIINFVTKFGKEYGYTFETEAEFDKFCLVNDAVYVAKYKEPLKDKKTGKDIWWTATGTQFAVPYVFKKLFTHEPIVFEDMCETKSVSTALYLDMNENLPDVSAYEAEISELWKKINDPNHLQEPMKAECDRIEELTALIDGGHNYRFIGKVGSFCPIKPGCNGGVLVREAKDKYGNLKYGAATGAKGYRWLESEMVKTLGKEKCIDMSYYNKLVDDAIATISQYGDFEWFTSEDPYFDGDVPF